MTAGFQAGARDHAGDTAMFISGEDASAKTLAGELVRAVGFEPVDLGGWAKAATMDAPRRAGAVYGEAYSPREARKIAASLA